jgi:hypothetical protein
MLFLLVATLLTQSSRPEGAETVIAQMKAVLAMVGEEGPFRVQVVDTQQSSTGTRWYVKLSGHSDETYTGWLGGSRKEVTLWRGDERSIYLGSEIKAPSNPKAHARAESWARRIAGRAPLRFISERQDQKGKADFFFAILRNGYPFVSRPRFGYDITMSIADGRFIAVFGNEQPPKVDDIPAKLDKKAALAAFDKVFREKFQASLAKSQNREVRVWYEPIAKPELGYYLQKNRALAGLVWRFEFMYNISNPFGSRGSSYSMLIDAVTGNVIPTDVMP